MIGFWPCGLDKAVKLFDIIWSSFTETTIVYMLQVSLGSDLSESQHFNMNRTGLEALLCPRGLQKYGPQKSTN